MQDIHLTAASDEGLSKDEIRGALGKALEGRALKRVLIIPPDFTRFHSNAGFITEALYGMLAARGAEVDIMPALGTHVPVTEAQWKAMFGSVPFERMIVHKWRTDVVKLGDIPAEVVSEISTSPRRSCPRFPKGSGRSRSRWSSTAGSWTAATI